MFDESKARAVAAVLLWFLTRSIVNVYLHPNIGGYSQVIYSRQYNLLCNVVGDLYLVRAEQLVIECTYEQE